MMYNDFMFKSGFREIPHTADWEIEAWAPDLSGLFEQVARGMYRLEGMELDKTEDINRKFEINSLDTESLLVRFLNELLFFQESDNLGFYHFLLAVDQTTLQANLTGAKIKHLDKEIKAVTWHQLNIQKKGDLFKVHVVFDV